MPKIIPFIKKKAPNEEAESEEQIFACPECDSFLWIISDLGTAECVYCRDPIPLTDLYEAD